ncbi:hypothetical protein SLU01_33070 [Sporosarcina luteola]|uniref:Uncharacterized protein n=1 Tax=Sporosarcina luteola TaxID=582850 RepID=A0A511ZC21_9BACL|nr:hypothetical protein SLU01_33070 [Sporosarcina luteola]
MRWIGRGADGFGRGVEGFGRMERWIGREVKVTLVGIIKKPFLHHFLFKEWLLRHKLVDRFLIKY